MNTINPSSSSTEKRQPDLGDFSLCTTLAALCYIIAASLGSGSYKDMLSGGFAEAFTFFLIVTLSLLTSFFLLVLMEFSTGLIHLHQVPSYDIPALKLIRNWLIFVAVLFLLCGIVIYFDFVPWFNNNKIAWVLIFSAAAGIFGTFSILSFVVYEIFKLGLIYFLYLGVAFLVSCLIWLNAYRDAEKGALVADSEYCYWLGSSITENTIGDTREEMLSLATAKQRYTDDRACKTLTDNHIIHQRYLTKQ